MVRTRERSDGLDRREAGIEARAGVRADELATERTAVRDRELDEREGCLDKRENGIEVRAGVRADELATERTAVRDRELDEREGRLDKRESGIEVRAGVRADELATERTAVRDRELDEREGRLDKRESGIEVRAGVRADELATERMAVRDRELDEREGRLDKRESGIEVRAGVRADELATERMAVRDRELDEREGRLDKRESGIEVRAGVRADELATERTAAEKAREWATQEATSAGQLHAAVLAGRHDLVHTKAWRQVELLTDSAEEWVRDTWPDTDRGEDCAFGNTRTLEDAGYHASAAAARRSTSSGSRRRLHPAAASRIAVSDRPVCVSIANARSRVELLFHLREEEKCLLHRIGDQQDTDEFEVLQRRVPFQVPGSNVAHHLAPIAGEPSCQIPSHRIVGLHRIDQRKKNAIDALANSRPELSEGGSVVELRQGLAQNSQRVFQPAKELLAIAHGIVVLDSLHGMECLQVGQELDDVGEQFPGGVAQRPDPLAPAYRFEVLGEIL